VLELTACDAVADCDHSYCPCPRRGALHVGAVSVSTTYDLCVVNSLTLALVRIAGYWGFTQWLPGLAMSWFGIQPHAFETAISMHRTRPA
jgi:hypothetical protein